MSKVNKLTDSSGQHLRGKHHCAYCGQVIASLVPINEGRAAAIKHALNCPQHPCHLEIKSLRIQLVEANAAIVRKDEALKPFAVAANAIPAILSDDNWPRLNPNKATITVGHCRAAKRALESKL